MNTHPSLRKMRVRDCDVRQLDPIFAFLVDSIWRPFRARRSGVVGPRVETLG
jgi:hypothetical protein